MTTRHTIGRVIACAITVSACAGTPTGASDDPSILPSAANTPLTLDLSGPVAPLTIAGSQAMLVATVTNSDGALISGNPVRWVSSDPAIIGVSSDGTVTAGGQGSATITATMGNLSESMVVTASYDGIMGGPVMGTTVECTSGFALLYACDGVDLLSFMPRSALGTACCAINDLWGWVDNRTGREYLIVMRSDGASFVDATDPNNPRFLGSLPITEGARRNSWHDVKVYKNHAFIVADGAGPHGMQVFDLTDLRGVVTPKVFKPVTTYREINSAHNIVINEETGFAYAVGASSGGNTCGGGLHMININNPRNPKFAGCFSDPVTGRRGTGYTHDAQCVLYRGPDLGYAGREICFGANETHLSIADVSDKGSPVAVSRATYPSVAYTHQGWLTEDQQYFYINDELDESGGLVTGTRTLIWDVRELDDPILVGEFIGPTNAIDHNHYIRGDRMFMSNYQFGVRIVDVSNPESPLQVGHFDTAPYFDDVEGFWGSWSNYPYFPSGNIAVTSRYEGLFILRANN